MGTAQCCENQTGPHPKRRPPWAPGPPAANGSGHLGFQPRELLSGDRRPTFSRQSHGVATTRGRNGPPLSQQNSLCVPLQGPRPEFVRFANERKLPSNLAGLSCLLRGVRTLGEGGASSGAKIRKPHEMMGVPAASPLHLHRPPAQELLAWKQLAPASASWKGGGRNLSLI